LSKVLKANQLAVSDRWRPVLVTTPEISEQPSEDTDATRQQELEAQTLLLAQAEAKKIISEAKAQAAAVLAKAEAELERQREKGYVAGWEAGLAAGQQEAEAAWQGRLAELELQRQELIKKDAAWLREAEQEVLELSIAVAERVIAYKLQHDDAAVQAALRQVLQTAQGCREALLTVSPDDFAHLWPKRREWQNVLPGIKEFELKADPDLEPGDIILQTNQGTIDARLDVVLEKVAQLYPAETDDEG